MSGSTPLAVASRRFLASQIRKAFDFSGVPLRVTVRHKQPRRERKKNGDSGSGGWRGRS